MGDELNHKLEVEIERLGLENNHLRSTLAKIEDKLNQASVEEIKRMPIADGKPQFTFSKAAADKRYHASTFTQSSSYQVHLILDKVPLDVNPRDTLAAHLISKRFAQLLFYFAMQNVAGRTLCFVAFVLAEIFVILCVAVSPSFGWFTLIGIPSNLIYLALLNRQVFRALTRTFEWWGMVYFSVVAVASAMDAVSFDPPRVAAFAFLALGLLYTVSMDARPLLKRRPNLFWRIFWIVSTGLTWTLLILWWCEKWLAIRQTIVPIGSVVTLDVQSIGFSSYFTVCVVLSKYALVMFFSKESNQCIILKAPLAYRYRSNEKDTAQVQSMV